MKRNVESLKSWHRVAAKRIYKELREYFAEYGTKDEGDRAPINDIAFDIQQAEEEASGSGELDLCRALAAEREKMEPLVRELLRSCEVLLRSRLTDGRTVVAYEIMVKDAMKAVEQALAPEEK